MVLFALSLTVLVGMAGLAIDVLRLYDAYAREQRAAEAGALAGVLYLPTYYSSAAPTDGNTAISRAAQEVYKNGFGTLSGGKACVGQDPSQEVAVCSVSGKPTDLRVTITESLDVVLLSVVGAQASIVSASAQSEYLPPIQLGARQNYFGDEAECSATRSDPTSFVACDPHGGSNHVQNFLATMNGPDELKENGDPFVYCEEGPSQAATTTDANWNTTPGYPTYNGFPYPSGAYPFFPPNGTNHPQYSDAITNHCGLPVPNGSPGNPDQQPSLYTGPATSGSVHPGAYNYAISIDQAGSSVWIYNPNYVADGVAWAPPSPAPIDYFMYPYRYYGALQYNQHYLDDPSMYFNMTYTLYRVPLTYLRTTDMEVATQTFPPYDKITADLGYHSCLTDGTQVYNLSRGSSYGDLDAGGCVATTSVGSTSGVPTGGCYHRWCAIATGLAAGFYRLAVEATGKTSATRGWGSKSYAVKICGAGATIANGCTAGPQTSVAGWNNMDVFFETPNSALFDLANVPAVYAGRSITISLYDPGDSYNGDVFVRIVPPAGSGITVAYPSGVRTGNDDTGQLAIWATRGGDHLYNGLWINTPVTLPPSYAGGWWQIYYSVTGNPDDKVCVKFSIVGSPVHLVPVG